MKTTITAGERLQLIGLCSLAQRYNTQLIDVRRTIEALLAYTVADRPEGGFDDPQDHIGDAVYADAAGDVGGLVDELLTRIKVAIAVVGEAAAAPPATDEEEERTP
jgi:hypothetical protein